MTKINLSSMFVSNEDEIPDSVQFVQPRQDDSG